MAVWTSLTKFFGTHCLQIYSWCYGPDQKLLPLQQQTNPKMLNIKGRRPIAATTLMSINAHDAQIKMMRVPSSATGY